MGTTRAVSVASASAVLPRFGTEMMVTRAEFLMRAMKMLPRGWTTVRIACGRTMTPSSGGKVIPNDRAAAPWPLATAFIPERTVSPTNVPV